MSVLGFRPAINSFDGKPAASATTALADSECVGVNMIVEDMPQSIFPDRPWGPGNNPKTAVHAFLATHHEFAIDADIHKKLLITVAPDGYLKRNGQPFTLSESSLG